MTLHKAEQNLLKCHYCGMTLPMPDRCPECGSSYIGAFGMGTQKVAEMLAKRFPQARILRADRDSMRRKNSSIEVFQAFAKGKADILVGTQMIVKGHDFPDVTLVGILAADLSLNADDYRSGERTFQLLTQAVGRAGRGRKEGHALIQTYSPDHYSIQTAAKQDYEEFYQEEMGYRLLMDYPPAAHMMAVLGSSEDEKLLETAMHYLGLFTGKIYAGKDLHVIGPAPASVGKVKDVYRRVLYLKHENYDLLVRIKDRLEEYIQTRLSDGAEALLPNEADSILIAGMGGELILHILTEGESVCSTAKELILQPQSEIHKVREYLRQHQYKIEDEDMVCEEGKYYPMMRAVKTEQDETWNRLNDQTIAVCDIYGPLLLRNGNPVLRRFLVRQHGQLTQILQTLEAQKESEQIIRRIAEVQEKLQQNESAYTILGAIKSAGI